MEIGLIRRHSKYSVINHINNLSCFWQKNKCCDKSWFVFNKTKNIIFIVWFSLP